MAVFDNPSRAQFERFTTPGQAPTTGQPGAFAVNTTDRKLWSFDPAGAPVLIATDIGAHADDRAYSIGQLSVQDGALWRANANLSPGAFDTANWTPITDGGVQAPPEPTASGALTGGTLGQSGGSVTVTAGTGVIVDATDPSDVSWTQVTWAGQTVAIAAAGQTTRAVVVDTSGTIAGAALTPNARRAGVTLGYAEFDDGGDLIRVSSAPRVARQAAEDLADTTAAMGGAFILSGLVLSAGTGLALNLTTGTIYAPQTRWRSTPANPSQATISGGTGITFDVRRANGQVVSTAQTAVPTDVFDGGTIPNGFSAVLFLFAAVGGYYWLHPGMNTYAGLSAAIAALDAEWRDVPLVLRQRPDTVGVGAIAVTRGDTVDLTGRIFPIGPGPQLCADFLIAQGSSGFLRTDGANAMQGSLDMAGNSVQNSIIDEGVF